MKKTIYIVTTRSFNENTLFNKNNCQYVSYKENEEWYKTAFPQYFTDVIQFINIQAVEQIALSE